MQTHSDPSSHVYFVYSVKPPYNFSLCHKATHDMISYEVTGLLLYSLLLSKKFLTFCLHVDHQRTIQSDSKVSLIATANLELIMCIPMCFILYLSALDCICFLWHRQHLGDLMNSLHSSSVSTIIVNSIPSINNLVFFPVKEYSYNPL